MNYHFSLLEGLSFFFFFYWKNQTFKIFYWRDQIFTIFYWRYKLIILLPKANRNKQNNKLNSVCLVHSMGNMENLVRSIRKFENLIFSIGKFESSILSIGKSQSSVSSIKNCNSFVPLGAVISKAKGYLCCWKYFYIIEAHIVCQIVILLYCVM